MKCSFTTFIGILSLFLFLTITTLHAQVRTKRFKQPQDLSTFGIVFGNKQATPTLSLSAIDAAPLLVEDNAEAKAGRPLRFGLRRAVNVDIIQAAAQTQQNGYRTYTYQISAEGAFSLNLIFDRFQIKKGSKLFLYNSDRTMLIGPITEAQNLQSGEFWTDLVQGSTLLIDLQEPISGSGTSELHLRAVVHAYKNLFPNTNKAFGNAGACHPNMICYPGYQVEGDGVAMILTAGGSRLCTGSMVNDMQQSFRSFFLTAFHCVDLIYPAGSLSGTEINDAQNWLVRFNYQSTTCTPGVDDLDVITLNGTTFRGAYANSDFALVELVQQVPPDVNTTYNGWNRGAATTSSNFGIHHPQGDVKKISFTNDDTQVSGYGTTGNDHLISFWGDLGVTDPGSSGSPLFDGNRRIVGQLHGGPSFCGATGASLRDYYGRFFVSWPGGSTNDTRLSNWLDPDNGSNTTTDGVKPIVSGPVAFTNTGSFGLNTLTASITSWTVTGGADIVSPTSGTGNTANLIALSSGTNLTITFGVDAGQSYPIKFAKVFDAVSRIPTVSDLAASPTPVCAGSLATFTATVGNFAGTYSFTLTNGSSPISGTSSSPAFSQSVSASGSGLQTFSLTVTSNPSFTATNGTNTTPVSVTVTPLTSVVNQPVAASVICAGASVMVAVSTTDTPPLSYQWYQDGSAVSGQTSATLTLASTTTANAGSYSLVVTGACNSVTSTAFSLSLYEEGVAAATVKAGLWNDPTVWACGTLPTAGSMVNLKHVVTIPTGYTALGGTVRYDAGGGISYQPGGKLRLGL